MLQSKAVDLAKAADLLKVCMDEMCRLRNQFEDVKKEATDIAQKWSIRPEFEKKRLRTVKRHFGELCEDQRLEDPESLCRVTVYYRTLDIITTQLNFRFTGLHEVVSSFSVLEPISLQNLSDSELYEKASSFVKNTTTMSSFPEVCTAMLLFLTIPVTTASAECSFSKLKLVKNYLRSTMAQERLEGLALLSIEQGTARELNLSKVTDRFAEMKAKKKEF
ncbi:zinc finger MYM-type protein 1-like [Macrobrachium rosenbergii]|uniref:zinc finger MYM-type protein 1-like n=1 Tax=Macrobrachium rosenbergii TaxID=79674 RepID=UPI0034D7939E